MRNRLRALPIVFFIEVLIGGLGALVTLGAIAVAVVRFRDPTLFPILPSLPRPLRLSTTDTVESGIASVSAISAAVIRSCRSATITATRSVGVRLATRFGAEERSTRPASPAALYRATHLCAQRTLTPAADAAAVTVQPCSITRSANNRRPLQLRAALR